MAIVVLEQPSAGPGLKLQSKHIKGKKKKEKRASRVKENPVRCDDPTNCPREEWK